MVVTSTPMISSEHPKSMQLQTRKLLQPAPGRKTRTHQFWHTWTRNDIYNNAHRYNRANQLARIIAYDWIAVALALRTSTHNDSWTENTLIDRQCHWLIQTQIACVLIERTQPHILGRWTRVVSSRVAQVQRWVCNSFGPPPNESLHH